MRFIEFGVQRDASAMRARNDAQTTVFAARVDQVIHEEKLGRHRIRAAGLVPKRPVLVPVQRRCMRWFAQDITTPAARIVKTQLCQRFQRARPGNQAGQHRMLVIHRDVATLVLELLAVGCRVVTLGWGQPADKGGNTPDDLL